MSEENVEIVRKSMTATLAGDWESVGQYMDPNVEMHGTIGGLTEGGTLVGTNRIAEEFETEDAEAWEERTFEATEILDAGDQVVVLLHEFRRGRGSGVELESDTAVVISLKNGLITRLQGYMEQAAALEAAGIGKVGQDE